MFRVAVGWRPRLPPRGLAPMSLGQNIYGFEVHQKSPEKNSSFYEFQDCDMQRSGICLKCDISNLSFLRMFARALLQCGDIAGWTAMGTMTAGYLSMSLKGVVQDSLSRSRWGWLAGVADGEIRLPKVVVEKIFDMV